MQGHERNKALVFRTGLLVIGRCAHHSAGLDSWYLQLNKFLNIEKLCSL
jgi:hypothetical protein